MTGGKTKPSAWNAAILYAYIAAGSVLGGVARYLLSLLIESIPGLPWATLFVNVTGSFIIGFYSTLSGPDGRLFAAGAEPDHTIDPAHTLEFPRSREPDQTIEFPKKSCCWPLAE